MDERKRMVRDGYDAVAAAYAEARRQGERERRWFERFCAALPERARVLDLGCGNGAPQLLALLQRGFRVTGVDFSPQQVARARQSCAAATIIEADVAEVELSPASFDGVLAHDVLFHLPRAEHAATFGRIGGWLVRGGVALLTFGDVPPGAPGELRADHLGAPTFYDAWPLTVALERLHEAGLTMVDHHVEPNPPGVSVEGGHVIALLRR
jgi:SAM-dependent methyltransferase